MGTLTETAQALLAEAEAYDAQARRVLELRRRKDAIDGRIHAARLAWEAANAALFDEAAACGEALQAAEAEWRRLAERRAATLRTKSLPWGVVVAETTRVVYDADRALAWAKARGTCLLLDKRAFEDVAKHAATNATIRQTSGIDFVTLDTRQQVRLPSTDRLAFLLEAAQREAEAATQRRADGLDVMFSHVPESQS
ncbi:MAG TPA: hypothetical protein VF406_04560 [Thermodesulfobacteriota bacterium]